MAKAKVIRAVERMDNELSKICDLLPQLDREDREMLAYYGPKLEEMLGELHRFLAPPEDEETED
jgi:hypothetical protein